MSVLVGLEIHKQLDGKKLFCECMPENSCKYDKFTRKLHPVAGEDTLVDVATLFEKPSVMRYVTDNGCCLVEMDEEPPHDLNEYALHTALMISFMLKSNVFEEIYVMRKIIKDGSMTGGFQRTMMISVGGYLGGVKIQAVYLEEDSARKKDGSYMLSRLGIPLVEIATEPFEYVYGNVEKTAHSFGKMLQSTKRVRRGLGTIRQDINVSMDGGTVVEIKGVQNLSSLDDTVEEEIKRQEKLRGLSGNIHKVCHDDGKIYFTVSGCFDILKKDLEEVAEILDVKINYHASYMDVLGDDVEKAANFIYERIMFIKEHGVPIDTRLALPDCTTRFLRPRSGRSRMYPETDVPVIPVRSELLGKIKNNLPIPYEEAIADLEKTLNHQLAVQIYDSEYLDLYTSLVEKTDINGTFIASVICNVKNYNYPVEHITDVFMKLNDGSITKESVENVLERMHDGETLDEIIDNLNTGDVPIDDLIKRIIEDNKEMVENLKDRAIKPLMGIAMKELRGKTSGQIVHEILAKELAKVD